MEKTIDRLGFELLETNMEIQRFIFAYQEGYRGFIPLNAANELTRLIKRAQVLRKKMLMLRPKGFKVYFK